MTRRRRLAGACAVTLVAAATAAAVAVPASAARSSLPFTDPRALGYIAFCDSAGHAVTSGNVQDLPFVATAISSVPAPSLYSGHQAKATLYAYQPRKDVSPGAWSGAPISGSSIFSNPRHPMAAVTTGDKTLEQQLFAFPAHWDGLVQLRLYLSAPNRQPYVVRYPATTIRVTGQLWSVVQGGTLPCAVGKAISTETLLLPSSSFPKPSQAPKRPTPAASAPTTGDGTTSPGPDGGTVIAAGDPAATSASDSSSGGLSPALVGLLGVLVGGIVVGVGLLAWSRRRAM
jgi:hypothetical protein